MINVLRCPLCCAAVALLLGGCAAPAAPASVPTNTLSLATATAQPSRSLYVPPPNQRAIEHVAALAASNPDDAARLQAIIDTPTAVWLTGGSPAEAEQQARQLASAAASANALPVLVIYNIPFRDCAQYSAGGATTVAAYQQWIDGVARGIGGTPALIALEPDGLGIIPWYTGPDGQQEWCQPTDANRQTAANDRFAMLNYAIDALTALPQTAVYLDGTHDGWLGAGDIAARLIRAGVARADGFFLNASNYRQTARLEQYGSWVAQCIYLSQQNALEPAMCASQYSPASANDPGTWALTDAAYEQAFAAAGLARDWAAMPHMILDTSRNGQGPWHPPAGAYPDAQEWCNPPGRGVGARPIINPAHPLVDAYVWIKVPGESDGQCSRGLGSGTSVTDPVWQRVDPAAGAWFPEQALELARLANPPLP